MVRISRSGLESIRFALPKPHQYCIFEHVYFARPDSLIFGRPVNRSREMLGRLLAAEHPAAADVVVPVPDSGVPAAIGYALESGIPFRMGDRKSTRLNSSHGYISYAVFCLKKKKIIT